MSGDYLPSMGSQAHGDKNMARASWMPPFTPPQPVSSGVAQGFRDGSNFIQMRCFSLFAYQCTLKEKALLGPQDLSLHDPVATHTPGSCRHLWASFQGSQEAFPSLIPLVPRCHCPALPCLADGPRDLSLDSSPTVSLPKTPPTPE